MSKHNLRARLGAKLAAIFQRGALRIDLAPTVSFFAALIDAILLASPDSILDDELRKQILACYVFGMLNAYGMRDRLPPPALMGIMTTLLHTKFGYAVHAADQFTQELVNSTTPEYHEAQNALIHRGIDGLHLWETQGTQAVVEDYNRCVQQIREHIA